MRDQIVGAVEIEPADFTDAARSANVWIAGEAAWVMRSHDVEASTMTRDASRPAVPKNSLHGAPGREQPAEAALARPARSGLRRDRHRHLVMTGEWCGRQRCRLREIGGDDDSAPNARRRYRHRIDQRAVRPASGRLPALAKILRAGGAHRLDHAASGSADLVAGPDFGGYGANSPAGPRRVADGGLQLPQACRRQSGLSR